MPVKQFRKAACYNAQRISKQTVLALVANTSDDPTPNNPLIPSAAAQPLFFLRTLPLQQWDVLSFDPGNFEVCIIVYTYLEGRRTGMYRIISLTIPELFFSPKS